MVLQLPPDYYQASFIHVQDLTGQTAVNTLGFHHEGSNFDGSSNGVAIAWATSIVSLMNVSWRFDRIVWRVQDGAIKDVDQNTTGSSGDDGVPPQVAIIVNKVTNLPGRKMRGRLFVCGASVVDVNAAGVVIAARKTVWQNAFNAFRATCVTNEMTPVLIHNDDGVPGLSVPNDIDHFEVQNTVGTQKRRIR